MKSSKFLRTLSLILAAITALMTFSFAALADEAREKLPEKPTELTEFRPDEATRDVVIGGITYKTWLTGRFNGNNYSSNHYFRVKKTGSTAKFKVYTYNANGKQTSGTVYIRITTPQDSGFSRTISCKSGSTVTLPGSYSTYYVSICRRNSVWNPSANIANCYYWAFKATSNGGWAY